MRVLVTGATGFVGSHTVRALLAGGHAVRVLVRQPEKVRQVFGAQAARLGVVQGDVLEPARVRAALHGCEAVVHAAAQVSLRPSDAAQVHAVNVQGSEQVLGLALRGGIARLLYVSSAGALVVPGGPPVTGASPVAEARSGYGRSKAAAERLARRLQAEGAALAITYPAAVVGPDDPGLSESNHGLRTLVRDLTVETSSGFQPVDVRDLAALHRRLLEGGGAGRWPAAARMVPWREMAAMLEGITGVRVRRLRVPGALLRAAGRLADRIRSLHELSFPLSREGMEFATRWPGVDASETTRATGIPFRPPEATFADALRWMVAAGHLEARHAEALAQLPASPSGGAPQRPGADPP